MSRKSGHAHPNISFKNRETSGDRAGRFQARQRETPATVGYGPPVLGVCSDEVVPCTGDSDKLPLCADDDDEDTGRCRGLQARLFHVLAVATKARWCRTAGSGTWVAEETSSGPRPGSLLAGVAGSCLSATAGGGHGGCGWGSLVQDGMAGSKSRSMSSLSLGCRAAPKPCWACFSSMSAIVQSSSSSWSSNLFALAGDDHPRGDVLVVVRDQDIRHQ
ncbi:hypothetical protein AKJ16_DCAP13534, partial [Drosera capensis]